MRRGDAAVELNIATQVELVGDIIQIALGLGLRREVLFPIPFFEQFLRERVAVGPALGVETRAGIAVPVPGAADPAAGLEHPHPQPELAQFVELIETGNTGTDHDRVEIEADFGSRLVPNCLQRTHAVLLRPPTPHGVGLVPRPDYPSRSNGKLSESRPAADCNARLSAVTAWSSRSCECPAAVRISSNSQDGDKTGTDTSVTP